MVSYFIDMVSSAPGGVIPGDYTHPTAMPIAARVEMIAIEAMGADYVVELDNCNNCSMYF